MALTGGPTRVMSFGFRWLTRPVVTTGPALVLDIRHVDGIRNPFHEPDLRHLTGLDPAVRDYIQTGVGFDLALFGILTVCEGQQGPVCIGCHGGRHRSVFIATLLGERFGVPVTHLHLDRD